jgi:hypothetical protein
MEDSKPLLSVPFATEVPSRKAQADAAPILPPVDQPDSPKTTDATVQEMESQSDPVIPPPEIQGPKREVEKPNRPAKKVFVNSHACPEPLPGGSDNRFGPYQRFMERALGLPPKPEQLVVIRISPSFHPDRTLSLVQKNDGTYVLRSTRLTEHVWASMMKEMMEQQGSSAKFDHEHQVAALSHLHTEKSVKERKLDAGTAKLFLQLWRSLLGRAQIVRNVSVLSWTADGTEFRAWHGGHGAATHSPETGSVLDAAVTSAERLEQLVAEGSSDEEADLESARLGMRDAWERTNRKEPCRRLFEGWPH